MRSLTIGRTAAVIGGLLLFFALATANSGGYRYGISDQAFYEPAIRRALDPSLFPRDASLIAAQARLMGSDKIIGGTARLLHTDLPPLFLAIYALTLVMLASGAAIFVRGLGWSRWATIAFLALLTLRHRIAKTGANTLEGYMHPRQLAFALGVVALATTYRKRPWWTVGLLIGAALLHPTTALWFALFIGPAAVVMYPSWRRPLIGVTSIAAIASIALLMGPLSSRLVIMDAAWIDAFVDKDYVFPMAWPAYAWIMNLAYVPVIALVWRQRVRAGAARPEERGLVAGAIVLLIVFLISVPLTAAHVALVVQLQVTRVFWVLDFIALAYVAWWLTSGVSRKSFVAAAVALILVAMSLGRGVYVMHTEDPSRPLVQEQLADSQWVQALDWLRTQPASWNVLADPGHAWRYGISVRVGAQRDTVIESVKDSALAMYDRDIALRVTDRSRALEHFDAFTTNDIKAAAERYDVDAVIVDKSHVLDLPVLYRNADFVIYGLR